MPVPELPVVAEGETPHGEHWRGTDKHGQRARAVRYGPQPWQDGLIG